MIEREVPLNEDLSENFPAMKFDFPYLWFWAEIDNYIGGYITWHWHDEPEFCHVLFGTIEYQTPNEIHILKAGDGIFINSNVLHKIIPHNNCKNAIMLPQVFNKLLLIGYHHSIFDTRYYAPITNCMYLKSYVLKSSIPSQAAILQFLHQCYLCAKRELPGYELQVRNHISQVWLMLYNEVKDQIKASGSGRYTDNTRTKLMLNYIQSNYNEKITLKNISAAANISERECIRCFKKNLNTTPFKYLMEYRIETAANMLLHTEKSLTEIALHTGFNTSSYFSRVFKEHMNCNPKKYRANTRKDLHPQRLK